jgi:hypothetical protein
MANPFHRYQIYVRGSMNIGLAEEADITAGFLASFLQLNSRDVVFEGCS